MTITNTKDMQLIELTINNKQPMATSVQIARHFGKQHKNVLRSIENIRRNLADGISDNWHGLNFEPMIQTIEIGNGAVREDPIYLLTRDAFMLLAMGFSGKEALFWKVKYIEEFNRMQKALNKVVHNKIELLMPPTESDQQNNSRCLAIVEGLLSFWSYIDEIPRELAQKFLCQELDISCIEEFGVELFSKAWFFILRSINFLESAELELNDDDWENHYRMMEACTNFRHTRDFNTSELLESVCGASCRNIPISDPKQLMMISWGLFNYSAGFSLGVSSVIKEFSEND